MIVVLLLYISNPKNIITMKLENYFAKISTLLLFFLAINANAENLFGGIEIGSKGVKVSIIDVQNVKKGVYEVKNFWTVNTGIARSISIDGNLAPEDIENTVNVVFANYTRLLKEFNIVDKNIYIVASSGVGLAKNTDILVQKLLEKTSKNVEVITSQLESKLLFKGCIPPKLYMNSVLIDIGGGNTKGGYVQIKNDDNLVFFPINLDLGTVTLTEKLNQNTYKKDISDYINTSISYRNSLNNNVQAMYDDRPMAANMKSVYMSGGAVWSFYTLFNGTAAANNYNEFTLDDVLKHHEVLLYNYEKFVELAKTDAEVDKVIKTYNQRSLIAANSILIATLQNLNNIDDKKIYYAKQGSIAWLLSYISESAKGIKVIY